MAGSLTTSLDYTCAWETKVGSGIFLSNPMFVWANKDFLGPLLFGRFVQSLAYMSRLDGMSFV